MERQESRSTWTFKSLEWADVASHSVIQYSKGSCTILERFLFNLVQWTVQSTAPCAHGDSVNPRKGKEQALQKVQGLMGCRGPGWVQSLFGREHVAEWGCGCEGDLSRGVFPAGLAFRPCTIHLWFQSSSSPSILFNGSRPCAKDRSSSYEQNWDWIQVLS